MSGHEIEARALCSRLDDLLAYEAPLREAEDLALVVELALEGGEAGVMVGGEKAVARSVTRLRRLIEAAKADLEAMRAEFARPREPIGAGK